MKTIVLISLLICLVSSCRKTMSEKLKECQDFCGGEEKVELFDGEDDAYRYDICQCQNNTGYKK